MGILTDDDYDPHAVAKSIWGGTYSAPKPTPSQPTRHPYDDFIEESAARHGVDPDLVRAQMGQESSFKPKALSPKGASGLMQLMPDTARSMGVRDIYDPKQNIEGGVKYLRQQLDAFNWDVPLALAAYNAGPGAVQKHGNKIPPYKETQNYVKTINSKYTGDGKPFNPAAIAQDIWGDEDYGYDPNKVAQDLWTAQPAQDVPRSPVSPTVPNIQTLQSPVPETPNTLIAQLGSVLDTNSPKGGILTTEPNGHALVGNSPAVDMLIPVPQANGGMLWLSKAKAAKLGIQSPQQADAYIRLNGLAGLIGKVDDVGDNTGPGQPTVKTVAPDGTELSSSIVTSPESAKMQAAVDQEAFPGGQSRVVDSADVIREREKMILPEDQPTPNPVSKSFEEYQKNPGLPENLVVDRNGEQHQVLEDRGDKVLVKGPKGTITLQAKRRFKPAVKAPDDSGVSVSVDGLDPIDPPQPQAEQPVVASPDQSSVYDNIDLSGKTGSTYTSEYQKQIASRLSSELNVPFDTALAVIKSYPIQSRSGGESSEENFASLVKNKTPVHADIAPEVKRKILNEHSAREAQKADFEAKVTEYEKTRPNAESPTASVVKAQMDMGLLSPEEGKKRLDEENEAFQTWRTEHGVNRDIEAARRVQGDEEGPNSRAQLLKQQALETLTKSGSFKAAADDKKRIEKKYENRPLARPTEFALNIGRQILNTPAYVGKAAGVLQTDLNPLAFGDLKPSDSPYFQFGKAWEERINQSENPDFKGELVTDHLAKGLGMLIAQGVATPILGPAALALPVAQAVGDQAEQAEKGGATRGQRAIIETVAGLAAIPDAVLKAKYLRFLNPESFVSNLTESVFSNLSKAFGEQEARSLTTQAITSFVETAAKKGTFGALTQVGQQELQNAANKTAQKLTYKPDITWHDVFVPNEEESKGMISAGLVGVFGGLFESVTGKMSTPELKKGHEVLSDALKDGLIAKDDAAKFETAVANELAKRNEGVKIENVNSPDDQKPTTKVITPKTEAIEKVTKTDETKISPQPAPVVESETVPDAKTEAPEKVNKTFPTELPEEVRAKAREFDNEWVKRAQTETVVSIGQLTARDKIELDKAVKAGIIEKGRGGGFPQIKTVYGKPGTDFAAEHDVNIEQLKALSRKDAENEFKAKDSTIKPKKPEKGELSDAAILGQFSKSGAWNKHAAKFRNLSREQKQRVFENIRAGDDPDIAIKDAKSFVDGGNLGDPLPGKARSAPRSMPDPISNEHDNLADHEAHAMAMSKTRFPVSEDVMPGFEKTKKSHTGVMKSYAKILDNLNRPTPIRLGRFTERARGIYNPKAEVIRLKEAGNIPTAAHEVFHGVQKVMFGGVSSGDLKPIPRGALKELVKLGKELYGDQRPSGGYRTEGFAEFGRLFLTQDDVSTKAPQMHKYFTEEFLPNNPELKKSLDAARHETDAYRNQGALNRADANMSQSTIKGRLITAWQNIKKNFATEMVDELTPLLRLSKTAEKIKGSPLSAGENPYKIASYLRANAQAKTHYMAFEGMIDAAGNKIGPSLNEALAPVRKQRNAFVQYLWARRALERWSKDKNPGMSKEDAEFIVEHYDSPEFQLAADGVYKWNSGVLNYIKGMVPDLAPSIDSILEKSLDYVPLMREMGDATGEHMAGPTGTLGNIALHKMTGSGRRVKSIVPQMIANAEKMVGMAHKRKVVDSIIKLSELEGMGSLVEKVPTDKVPVSISIQQIESSLRKAGADLKDVDLNEIVTFFTPAKNPRGKDPIIPVMRDGKMEWYQVPEDLYATLNGLDLYRLPKVIDLFFGAPARAFRLGTTGLRPSFSLVTNPLRDVQTLLMQSQAKNPAKLMTNYVRAMIDGLNPKQIAGKMPEMLDMYHRLGVSQSQPLGADEAITTKAASQAFQGRTRRIVTSPVNALREIFGVPEAMPRMAEMRTVMDAAGIKPGDPITFDQAVEIGLAGKQATVDFSAAGKFGKVANQMIPFFNANIQGNRSMVRSFQRSPTGTVLKGLTAFALPTLALWWANKDEEWYKETPEREKNAYWHFNVGDKIIMIPRAQEWGGMFSSLPEGIANSWYQKDPEGFTASMGYLFDLITPPVEPVAIKAAHEQWANQIEFFDRPIVPKSEENLPPSEQYNEYTSAISKWLGKQLPDKKILGIPINSPRRIDAAIRSIGGGLASDLAQSTNTVAGVDREKEESDLPIIGRIFRRGGTTGSSSKSLDKFYEKLDQAKKLVASKEREATEHEKEDLKKLQDAADAMSNLKKEKSSQTNADRYLLTRMIRGIAVDALEGKIPYKPKPSRDPRKTAESQQTERRKRLDRYFPGQNIVPKNKRQNP